MTFKGKRVLITGASSGIGAELAQQLARDGARIALSARRADRLESEAEKCRKAGGEAHVVVADVSQEHECKRMVEESVRALGGLDIVFVNAGISMMARFADVTDLSIYRRLMEANYYSAVYTTYFALPHLKQSKGRVVAVSSLLGKVAAPTRTGYSASKHAMNGFFDCLRTEVADDGVGVTVICPGFVKTEIRDNLLSGSGAKVERDPAHVEERASMSVEDCVERTLAAVARGDRELVMTPLPKLALTVKVLFPGLIDRIARRRVQRSNAGV